jgi:hypothetical protein
VALGMALRGKNECGEGKACFLTSVITEGEDGMLSIHQGWRCGSLPGLKANPRSDRRRRLASGDDGAAMKSVLAGAIPATAGLPCFR